MEQPKTIEFDKTLCEMLVSAVRYALGRRTYIVKDTVQFIIKYMKYFDDNSLYIMLNDIKTAHDYGDEHIDKPHWDMLQTIIKNELHERGVDKKLWF